MPNKRDFDNARKNRMELIAAGLTRRDLFKMGLLTGAGYLVAKNGLSSRAWGFKPSGGGSSTSPSRATSEPGKSLEGRSYGMKMGMLTGQCSRASTPASERPHRPQGRC